jgi:two-component system LytT family sensor kinase
MAKNQIQTSNLRRSRAGYLDSHDTVAPVPPSPRNTRPFPTWVLFVALPVLFTVAYASQLMMAGAAKSWADALWQEFVYWSAWSLLSVLIFRFCRWLHHRTHTWPRYAFGLLAGAVVVAVLHPLFFQGARYGFAWLGWTLSFTAQAPAEFLPIFRKSFVGLFGASVVFYTGTVLAWHAATYYREGKDRHLKAVELESMLRKAQLQALRSQLNPHFLFNTLHSIAELVHENPPLAERMLLRLSELLRSVLHAPPTLELPLADELDFIKAYLEIEQMRLGDRLHVTWDIAPEAQSARVPSLILQPLVENAIQHGIAATREGGTLTIRARKNDHIVELQVSDDGPGLVTKANGPLPGVGLANTRDRLARLYGEQQQFELVDDHGVTVTLRLPYSAETESASHAG